MNVFNKYKGQHIRVLEKDQENEQEKSVKNYKRGAFFCVILLAVIAVCGKLLADWKQTPNINFTAGSLRVPARLDKSNMGSDELLVLVNYEKSIQEDYVMTPRMYGDAIVDIKIYENLTRLIDEAYEEDIVLWVASGYRSYEEQAELLERAVTANVAEGMEEKDAKRRAKRTIAEPGHSEHHLGMAVDFNTVSESFAHTKEYEWLQKHAEEYGFVQRYSKEKTEITGIDEEVWHYRYVGVDHARQMNSLDLCLEEYIDYLKEQN